MLNLQVDTSELDEYVLDKTFKKVAKLVLSKVVLPKPLFFPSERQGVTIFGKEILENRLKNYDELISAKDLELFISRRLSSSVNYVEPISQYLSLFREVVLGTPRKTKFSEVSEYISNAIMEGEVRPSDKGELMFYSKSSSTPIEMSLVSSTVKSLSFLSYFLKTNVAPGQIIFIDEPEINLHPRNQIKIARALVLLVNAGVNLILSTHSEYIIREINSLITLGSSHKENPQGTNTLLVKYSINKGSIIIHKNVGVYSFKDGVITKNEVTDTGFDIPEIDQDTREMNDRTMDIFMTLNEEE